MVGGDVEVESECGPRGDVMERGDEEFVGTWNDGGVASGRVVKRIPVDTRELWIS